MVLDFLRQQGFCPEVDQNNNIVFKSEMKTFIFFNNDSDEEFFQLALPGIFDVNEENHDLVLEAYESIKGMGFDEATAHMQTALAQAAQQHPDDARRFNLLRQPFHTAAPWSDLVGLALVDNPKERDIRIGTSTFRVRPTGYANGSLKCDIIKDGNPIRGRTLNLERMDPKEMYRIMKGIPVDTSYSALYSRGLLTLREGTPDEFRIFFNRFRDKLRALEPFLEAHTLKR